MSKWKECSNEEALAERQRGGVVQTKAEVVQASDYEWGAYDGFRRQLHQPCWKYRIRVNEITLHLGPDTSCVGVRLMEPMCICGFDRGLHGIASFDPTCGNFRPRETRDQPVPEITIVITGGKTSLIQGDNRIELTHAEAEQTAKAILHPPDFADADFSPPTEPYPNEELEATERMLRADIETARTENQRLKAQLPDGMEDCTIEFHECPKGHGWLTATNWVQHGCPTCEVERLTEMANHRHPTIQ